MKVIGIIGDLGSGKSTIAGMFERYGCKVLDCDMLYCNMLRDDLGLLSAVAKEFPEAVNNGTIDYKSLSDIILNDNNELMRLNRVAAPYVAKKIQSIIEASDGLYPAVVVDAADLKQSGVYELCDVYINISAFKFWRLDRIVERGVDGREGFAWKAAWKLDTPDYPIEEAKVSEIRIDNNDSLDELFLKVAQIMEDLFGGL